MSGQPTGTDQIRETVREKYAGRAVQVIQGGAASCCSPATGAGSCCSGDAVAVDPITGNLYTPEELGQVPETAFLASLGCGNPTALAALKQGERVLDLGSGGGIDVLLSARRVGPEGHAYGLDMTDEMLELAEKNRQKAGAENVTFLKGTIEAIPLPDEAVDVIISNCVINLSADKPVVIAEAYRVLAPGGRFAVSDVVSQGAVPDDLRADMEAWIGCAAGALEEQQYRQYLADAGFTDIDVEVTRVYDSRELARSVNAAWSDEALDRYTGSGARFVSAFIRARKPA